MSGAGEKMLFYRRKQVKGEKEEQDTIMAALEDEETNVAAAKVHIEEIRRRKFSIGCGEPNPLTEDLHHAVASLSAELYTKDVHFLMELVQNAEDNEYEEGVEPTLEFVLTDEDVTGLGAPATLLVFNNEVGFSRNNVESICSVGRSTKKGKRRQGFIGEKGIGFKSVFVVSTVRFIFSNGYHIQFSEEPNQDCGIGYIVPEWVSGRPFLSDIVKICGSKKALRETSLILTLKPEKVDAVKAELSQLHPEILLFLSKIKKISVRESYGAPMVSDMVSAISITSMTNRMESREKRATSCVVHLSAKETGDVTETCCYYMWRQNFPVKPENRVTARTDVQEWAISIAFPFGNRLTRGTSSVGIFAFLPTGMVTNFPFIVQADFILASSRETIVLDNTWNNRILDCVPTAFVNAFTSCAKDISLLSRYNAFKFLPARASPVPELNMIRESIKTTLQGYAIVPCETFSHVGHSCQPSLALRILPKFRELLLRLKEEGVPLRHVSSLRECAVHSSLEHSHYCEAMDFLGVSSSYKCFYWYRNCLEACNLILPASEDVYIQLLCFLADNTNQFGNFADISVFKYINQVGNVELCSASKLLKKESTLLYALEAELHSWLLKWNMEFGCPGNTFFLPESTLKALLHHKKGSSLRSWLSHYANVECWSAHKYSRHMVLMKMETNLTLSFAHFLYHSYRKNYIDKCSISSLCNMAPIIDGSYCVCTDRRAILVSAVGSKWMQLFGNSNPFRKQKYVDLAKVYSDEGRIAGEYTPRKLLMKFLSKLCRAKDLPELDPPNEALQVASTKLSREQAFLMLDWIRFLRTKGSYIPHNFIKSIQTGKWMKTSLGYNSPCQSILLDEAGKAIYVMMSNVLAGFSAVDEEFYTNRINLYLDELKYLGVAFGSDDVLTIVISRLKCLALSNMSKELVYSSLMFLRYMMKKGGLDEELLAALKEGRWLKTHKCYSTSRGAVLLQSDTDVESVLRIANLPVVDRSFYGSQIDCFLPELMLLGVVMDSEVFKLILENLTVPSNPSCLTANCGLLILKCIKCVGPAATDLIEKISSQPWLKTCSGFKCPVECVLSDQRWGCLLNIFVCPIIDEAFYGLGIRSFMLELDAVGVAIDFSNAANKVATLFKSHLSSSSLSPSQSKSLLACIKELKQNMSGQCPDLDWLSVEKWIKTRHGHRAPGDSILFSPRWATISLFVDLPLIDDALYGIEIYNFNEELKMLGVITNIKDGAHLVAAGLSGLIKTETINEDAVATLLECLEYLLSTSQDQSSHADNLTNVLKNVCFRTWNNYRKPDECVLFDPAWDGFLEREDVPAINERFYGRDMFVYKNALKSIGVKVDNWEVCTLLSRFIINHTRTRPITRIYYFLNKFEWSPELPSCFDYLVWIPNHDGGATEGGWVKPQLCILHDKSNSFESCLYSLDRYYKKDLLQLFALAFGVADFPSAEHYLQLWKYWESRGNQQVTDAECCSFWGYFLDNWNQHAKEVLQKNLTKLPATNAMEEIFLVNKEEVYIPDELGLKKLFMTLEGITLFAWCKCSTSSSVPPRKLYEIYESLGIKLISKSVECNVSSVLFFNSSEVVEPRNGLIGRGLIKLVLGFLAGPTIDWTVRERQNAAKSLLDLSLSASDKSIQVSYRLQPSVNRTVIVEAEKLVYWEKKCSCLLINKAGYRKRKNNIEFAACFSMEVAEGLLLQEKADAVDALSKLIQIGMMFEFEENAVEFLLTKENLELTIEDEEFLNAAFPLLEGPCSSAPIKRSTEGSNLLVPSTPVISSRKRRL